MALVETRPSHGGQQYGRLTVMFPGEKKHYWVCRCECGGMSVVWKYSLLNGNTTSCGCYNRERATTHGRSGTRLYKLWTAIKMRCTNPRYSQFALYGGRGIAVCPEWQASFKTFAADVGERPSPRHSLDRIDNSRGYEPGNVRWATAAEQNRNMRRNRWITIGDRTLVLTDWATQCGVNLCTVRKRLRNRWTIEQALELVPRGR